MTIKYNEIQELLRSRADLHARLNLMSYDGTPEIKERGDGKYLYIRKRVSTKLTSTYVGIYTEELYNLLLRNAREIREIRKKLRRIEKKLADAGYSEDQLSVDVMNNISLARANMKVNIYDQAVLEGVAISFPQTEEIIDDGKVFGVTATDVQKILNLKHAWEFILDKDVIVSKSDYYILSHIARLVNEGFFSEGGRIRGVPVTIGGSSYVPPLPNEGNVAIEGIIFSDNIDKGLHTLEYQDFCQEHPFRKVKFQKSCGEFHDRYIIIDWNTEHQRIYHCGASCKDSGQGITSITEVFDHMIYKDLINNLLKNPVLKLK